jgi:hypothetical protein
MLINCTCLIREEKILWYYIVPHSAAVLRIIYSTSCLNFSLLIHEKGKVNDETNGSFTKSAQLTMSWADCYAKQINYLDEL